MYYERYLTALIGSSGWASDADIAASAGCLEGRWDSPHAEGGVVLASHGGRVLADGGDECRHVLVIGATGTGKSRLIIMPSILYSLTAEKKRSLVVFDVKGELMRATRQLAMSSGYRIRRVNFRNPLKGDAWNPFAKINRLWKEGGKSRNKAWKLLEDIIASVFNDGQSTKTDPFWRTISASLFRGICSCIWESGGDLTLTKIRAMANSIPPDKDDDGDSLLFSTVDSLPEDSAARRNIVGFRNGSNTTRGNVIATFTTYLSALMARDDVIESMSAPESLDFQEIGSVPTVLYVTVPDDSVALGSLQSMLITQLIQDLNECAMHNGGTLPVRTDIYLDEICNIHPAVPGLETSLTIARSRGIRYILAIQSYSQLSGVYGLAADTIAANCSTWIALNIAKDETFRAKLSSLCGDNPLGDPLITPAQLALLRYEEGIVIRERMAPYFARYEDLDKVRERLRPDIREPGRG